MHRKTSQGHCHPRKASGEVFLRMQESPMSQMSQQRKMGEFKEGSCFNTGSTREERSQSRAERLGLQVTPCREKGSPGAGPVLQGSHSSLQDHKRHHVPQ